MARNALGVGLLLLLAATACGKGKEDEAAATAKIAAMRARARADSVRKARALADSLELVRFTTCSDSVKTALGKTKAGRRKLKAPVPEGGTLPEIAGACGQPLTRTPALAAKAPAATDTTQLGAKHADSAKAAPTSGTKPATATQVATAAVPAASPPPTTVTSVVRPSSAAAMAEKEKAATAARADSMRRAAEDSVRADSVHKAQETQVLRESFAYGGGSRDPFTSLIKQKSSGPELVDLQLVGIYQDLRSSSNSVVVLREKDTKKRHKLRVGDQIGRLKVAQIRPKDVVFTIEDFGFERQETLSLRKQEDVSP